MTISGRPTRLIAILLAAAALTATWTIWGTKRAEAVIAIIRTTGMFAVAHGQGTSAYVVNTWTGTERAIIINYTVFDGAGNILAQSERQRIDPGQASTFDYRPPDLAEGQRMPIRLVVTVEGDRSKPSFIATQEVYNVGDGKTTVFLPYVEQ